VNFTLIALAGLIIALLLNEIPGFTSSLVPFVICLSHVGITAVLILMIEKASKRRVQSYLERMDSGDPIFYFKYRLRSDDGTPISNATLYRLEAKISTEIRVTDVCYASRPDRLFIASKALSDEFQKQLLARIPPIFESEHVSASVLEDKGEYVKVSRFDQPALRKSA